MSRTRAAVAALLIVASAVATDAQGLMTRDEALAAVFPGATLKSEQLFLTPAQQTEVQRRAGGELSSALVARYVATAEGKMVGRAYVDTHPVRTKKESLLISLDATGKVRRIDVTAFQEPREYQAPDAWVRQYRDRTLTEDLVVDRAIRVIAGATLTARATNAAIRRVLAIDSVLGSIGGRP